MPKKEKKPFQVQVSLPRGAESKILPSVFTLQPEVKPKALSGFVDRLISDPSFRKEYAKNPVKHLKRIGIKVNPKMKGELKKINVPAAFAELSPEKPQAAAAVAAIVVILVVSPPPPAE